jgi:hypothetical protein
MPRKPANRPPGEREPKINTNLDPAVRRALDGYIAAWNATHEHPATIRTTVEAALKMFLRSKGHWPPAGRQCR